MRADLVPADSVIWIRKQQPQTLQVLDRIVRDWHGSGWLLEEGRKYQMAASLMVVELHERYRNEPRLSIPVTSLM